METPNIAAPLELPCGVTLPNRLVKAALSEALGDRRNGAPTEDLLALYECWARSGAGVLLSGHVIIDRNGREAPLNVVVEDDSNLDLLRRWAQVAQAEGAALWMQINHCGRQTPKRITHHNVAPSPIALRGMSGLFARPRELAAAEVKVLVERYANTAAIAQRAGFGGVQIHAAHGYLISQFLSPLSNQRDDEWGGDVERRRAFLLHVVRAVRAAVGPGFPIGVKLNSADFQRGGFTEEESLAVVRALDGEGIDVLEISGGNYESPVMVGLGEGSASTVAREAYFLDYAEKVRSIVEVPLLLTGGMRSAAAMEAAVAEHGIDLVGLGRPLVLEPDLPARVLDGSCEKAVEVEVKVGIRLLNLGLQTGWYQRQMKRLARGRRPDLGLGRWTTVVLGLIRQYGYNPLGIRARRRLPPLLGPGGATGASE